MNITISVITAVYNDERFIKQSVESILRQTFTDFEYIVVDDGSTDNTLAILNELATRDTRLRVMTQKNSGAAVARNLGINSSKGSYIALQDSDDISIPNRLEAQFIQLQRSPPNTISCTSHIIINTDGQEIATNNKFYKNINNNILKGSICFCTPTMMVSRGVLMSTGCYNPFYKKSEDVDLIYRLLENNAQFEKLNECLYLYRIRENSEGSLNSGVYPKRAFENHQKRTRKIPEDFSIPHEHFVPDHSFILKRHAREIFFAENYKRYTKYYLKHFLDLPAREFLPFFVYSVLPEYAKRKIKQVL